MGDDELQRYLPRFASPLVLEKQPKETPGHSTVPAQRPITLRMLLTHTAGLGYGPGIEYRAPRDEVERLYVELCKDTEAGRVLDLAAWVDRLADIPLVHQPGERFLYSYAIDVLGHVLEVVSGKDLAEFLQARVLKPIGMDDTSFAVPSQYSARLVSLRRLYG